MKQIAVYPGSFDPITTGHADIIERVSKLYDEVIVLIADSSQKSSLFSIEERKDLVSKSLSHLKNIKIEVHTGLTVDFVRRVGAKVIVRGLRAVVDFEYEMTMSSMNLKLAPEIETVLIFARPETYFISSRGVKEVARHHGSLDGLVPEVVKKPLIERVKGK